MVVVVDQEWEHQVVAVDQAIPVAQQLPTVEVVGMAVEAGSQPRRTIHQLVVVVMDPATITRRG